MSLLPLDSSDSASCVFFLARFRCLWTTSFSLPPNAAVTFPSHFSPSLVPTFAGILPLRLPLGYVSFSQIFPLTCDHRSSGFFFHLSLNGGTSYFSCLRPTNSRLADDDMSSPFLPIFRRHRHPPIKASKDVEPAPAARNGSASINL